MGQIGFESQRKHFFAIKSKEIGWILLIEAMADAAVSEGMARDKFRYDPKPRESRTYIKS